MKNTEKYRKFLLFSMWALTIANFFVFSFQPAPDLSVFYDDDFGHPFGSFPFLTIMLLPFYHLYLLLIVFGLYALISTVYLIISKGIRNKWVDTSTVIVLTLSLCAVGYGTFFKEKSTEQSDSSFAQSDHNILIKYNWHEIYREDCIWHGDTIVTFKQDTLIVDETNQTCHWTHKPRIHYRYSYFNKDKFTQDRTDATLAPREHLGDIQYMIECINHKNPDEIHYDTEAVSDIFRNDSCLCCRFCNFCKCFGYLRFDLKKGTATLKDSVSDITPLTQPADSLNYFLRYEGCLQKANGMPLIALVYKKDILEEEYYAFFDIESKRFVLKNLPVSSLSKDSLGNSHAERRTITSDDNALMHDGYPDLICYTERSVTDGHTQETYTDTIFCERYIMYDGQYQKEMR